MDQSDERQGSCLCGAVGVSARITSGIGICHCSQCRKWTGGGALHSVWVEDLEISGTEHIAHYQASEWGERGFCRLCGTSLYWRMKGSEAKSVAVGLFDDQSSLIVDEEIFVDCRAPWTVPYAGASQSTEAQEMAKLNEYQSGRDKV